MRRPRATHRRHARPDSGGFVTNATGTANSVFAFVDTLAKTLLTVLPEQSSTSVAKGKERYERFLKSTAATMLNGSHPLLRHGVEP